MMSTSAKVESITYDQNLKNFAAMISGVDKTYRVTLSDFEENESDKASNLAYDICKWVISSNETISEFCASKLLNLKNEVWLDAQEEPLSKETFMETIKLNSILAFSDGSFQLHFNDNDLFWGHVILVDVNKDHVLVDAEIAG